MLEKWVALHAVIAFLVIWNMFYFSMSVRIIIPTGELIFFRGAAKNHQPVAQSATSQPQQQWLLRRAAAEDGLDGLRDLTPPIH